MAAGHLRLAPAGPWTAVHSDVLEQLVDAAAPQVASATAIAIDMAGVDELDTLGAWLLERLLRRDGAAEHDLQFVDLPPHYHGLIEAIGRVNRHQSPPPRPPNRIWAAADSVGRATVGLAADTADFLHMVGALGVATARVVMHPRRFRLTSAIYQLYRVGWQAVPIMMLITFLIGGTIAQQGIFHFRKFGADAYVIDMVGILVIREIGVLIVAIMVGGPLRQRLHGGTWRHEDARGDRRVAHYGVRPDRNPGTAARRRAGLCAPHPGVSGFDGGALWRRTGGVAVWRHEFRRPSWPASRTQFR